MQRVGVLVHPTTPVLDPLDVVAAWTSERGLELVQIRAGEQPVVAPEGEVDACDLIVAVGGDGTILKALHASAKTRTPVLGVAYGSLGALTAVPTDELRDGLDRFEAGNLPVRELPALVIRSGGSEIAFGVNDLVVARGRGKQLLVDVHVDGELYVRLAGDGIAVATALGSSAYSMAAGGSLLAEGVDAIICTPLAMHGGSAPPWVAPGDAEVTVGLRPGHTGFYVDVDGFPVETQAEHFSVTRRHAYARLVSFDEPSSGLPRLRARGLILDSPRVLGEDRASARSLAARSSER